MDRMEVMRALVRVVELGTFSAAAEELRVKQSTVSKRIAALEEELGVQLIERTTRTRRVTEAGDALYRRARAIVAAYDDAIAEAKARTPEPRGRLKVSLPVVFGRRFVVPHLDAFLRRYPQIELELRFADRYVHLIDDAIDVAIRVGIPVDSSFRALKLASTGRSLVASPEHLAKTSAPEHPHDLRDHACLLHSGLSDGAVWTFTPREGEGGPVRASVRGRFAADNSDALLQLACAGHGVALLADWLVRDALADGALVALLPTWEAPPAPIRAVLPPGPHVAPTARAFIDALRTAWGDAEGPSPLPPSARGAARQASA